MNDTATATTSTKPKRWYIVHAYSNFENKVADSIREQAKQRGLAEHIGEVLGGRYPRGEFSRVRVQVAHPMDNGMVSGIPEFYLNHAQLRGQDGQVLAELELFPAVSENPNLAFDIDAPGPTRLVLRDNSGNEFDAAIP